MKIRLLIICCAMLPLIACSDSVGAQADSTTAAAAGSSTSADIKPGDPRIALAAKIPGARPEDLRATPVPGIYELAHGTDVSYVTADAKYVCSGDLYQITSHGSFPNLTEARRRELEMPQWRTRLAKLAAIPESEMLVFGPADARHTITVFTDVDCPWCRKLHSQIAQYNQLGIKVRYLFFPRTGPDTESWYRAEAVWCAGDRKLAFTRATNDQPIEMKRCGKDPVARDYKLGREQGVTGTPGIVLETGELLPGYLGPQDLLAYIKGSIDAAKRAN